MSAPLVMAVVAAVATTLPVAAALVLRRRFAVVTVAGASMEPSYRSGDRVLIRRLSPSRRAPGPMAGRVVVVARRPPSGAPPLGALLPDARPSDGPAADVPGPGVPEPGAPLSARRWMIKRVAASPGDPVPAGLGPALTREAGRPVPKDRYIVLGDNTDHSHDSRHTGFVERADILGVAVRRLTPRTPRATSSPRRR